MIIMARALDRKPEKYAASSKNLLARRYEPTLCLSNGLATSKEKLANNSGTIPKPVVRKGQQNGGPAPDSAGIRESNTIGRRAKSQATNRND
jgi:hypothetical protein